MTAYADVRPSHRLALAVTAVTAQGNCSGCGGCAALTPQVTMALSPDGFSRPVVAPAPRADDLADDPADDPAGDLAATFQHMCPGVVVGARAPGGSVRDPVLGPVVEAWQAWAADPDVRRAGSSGGALTALAAWLAQTADLDQVVAAGPDHLDPSRTTVVVAHDRDDVLATAGSRYAPVSVAGEPAASDPRSVVVGKPCEASALRRLAEARSAAAPFILSFFCAGVPSQHATDQLVHDLLPGSIGGVAALRYRGDGWPGTFSVTATSGEVAQMSYAESWGSHLGPRTQWRCKICPDGVGEAADVVAGDFWHGDGRGFPAFVDAPGRSVLLARTRRGHEAVLAAAAAGILVLEPVSLDDVASVQPLQVARRRTLAARLLAVRLARGTVPSYPGFGLLRLSAGVPVQAARAFLGTLRRLRRRPGGSPA